MNKIIFLLMAGLCGRLAAQTNAPLVLPVAAPAAKAPARPKPPTEIDSDSADFDLNSHQAIYRNHVVVVDPNVRMDAGGPAAGRRAPEPCGRVNERGGGFH
jgi:hypothetical protein